MMDQARKAVNRLRWSETLALESQENYEGQSALARVHAQMARNTVAREGKKARAALLQGDRARARMHSDAQHDAMAEAETHQREARSARMGAAAMRKVASGADTHYKVDILSERMKARQQEQGSNGQNSLAHIMGMQASEARNSAREQARAERAMRNAERAGAQDEEGLSEKEAAFVNTLRAVGDEEEAQRIEALAARRSMGLNEDSSEEEEEELEELEWSRRDASRASMLSVLQASSREKEAGAEE